MVLKNLNGLQECRQSTVRSVRRCQGLIKTWIMAFKRSKVLFVVVSMLQVCLKPEDEIINELLTLSDNATYQNLLSYASFLMSLSRREHLKHLFQGDYKDLICKKKKSVEVTNKLFGSELSKSCKDISEAFRTTTKMLNNGSSGSFHSFCSRLRDSFRFNKGN